MVTERSSIPRAGGSTKPKAPTLGSVSVSAKNRVSAPRALEPLVRGLLGGELPIRFQLWDTSGFGPSDGPGTMHVRSADALRRILWAPGELGFGRAYVAGDIELEGDVVAILTALQSVAPRDLRVGLRAVPAAFTAALRAGALGLPLPAPPEEARVAGLRHSLRRDTRAITHHYDVGNDFYELVLGPTMTYSCARFAEPEMSLEQAQESKHELICRKLGLKDSGPMRVGRGLWLGHHGDARRGELWSKSGRDHLEPGPSELRPPTSGGLGP